VIQFDQWLASQAALFADRPSRLSLMELAAPTKARRLSIGVHRNHGVELLLKPADAYLAYAGLAADWLIGDYDDSLAFTAVADRATTADLVWLDYARYASLTPAELNDWLTARLGVLRDLVGGPIIVTNWASKSEAAVQFNRGLKEWADAVPGIAVADLEAIRRELGGEYFDLKRSPFTGTMLSDRAMLAAARVVASRMLPGLLQANRKAVAVDLDNCLYRGVLGEDGIAGIELTEDHRALQQLLVDLVMRGILLVCVSRNEPADVETLFAERSDFPLQAAHFADWQVSWGDKVAAIGRAAQSLRIATDAFLFVDDNLGELAAVAVELPEVGLVAAADASHAVRSLRFHPCLWPSRPLSETDRLRTRDVLANADRERLAREISDPAEYVRRLGITLDLFLNPTHLVQRLSDLSRKTNQFTLSLRRISEVEVKHRLTDPDNRVVAVSMRDRLSDSGIIAAIFCRRQDDEIVVDELCMSCRALGRYVEDVIITEALDRVMNEFNTRRIAFPFVRGPRNSPALNWLATYRGARTLADEDEKAVIDYSAGETYPWRDDWNLTVRWSSECETLTA
jgi:FkbH-like protein